MKQLNLPSPIMKALLSEFVKDEEVIGEDTDAEEGIFATGGLDGVITEGAAGTVIIESIESAGVVIDEEEEEDVIIITDIRSSTTMIITIIQDTVITAVAVRTGIANVAQNGDTAQVIAAA